MFSAVLNNENKLKMISLHSIVLGAVLAISFTPRVVCDIDCLNGCTNNSPFGNGRYAAVMFEVPEDTIDELGVEIISAGAGSTVQRESSERRKAN